MKNVIIALFIPLLGFAQQQLNGTILDTANNSPLPGANVYWLNTQIGAVTDFDGKFTIRYEPSYTQLVISYVGYETDTITVNSAKNISHSLAPKAALDEVVISGKIKATSRSFLKATNTINVSSDELLKAACCNLSESFETNPSIDVNFADAITGTRRIKMLGLTSPYTLITTENVPSIRGAGQAFGLSFVPGTWVESIQITKGAGSVTNGFESIAGQINAELVKPATDVPFFVNAYGAVDGRFELNTHVNTKISDTWSTGLYVHGNTRRFENDTNNDGFLDNPLADQFNVMNRWQYANPKTGLVSFINFNYLNDNKQIGQTSFDPDTDRGTINAWGGEIATEKYGVTAKLGYVFPEIPYQSMGLQIAYNKHKQDSYFGLRDYTIEHNSYYANAMFSSIISDSRHNFKTGVSATLDEYKELVEITNFNRIENSIGAFFEYAYDDLDKLTITAGLRADNHNRLGFFITPRVHARYTPWDKSAFRISAGRGKRSANIFTENLGLFSSGRAIQILDTAGSIYGLDPEIAWNYGVSFLQGFNLFNRKADIAFDYYRTDFQNQVVVDWEQFSAIRFYNLDGSSVANSYQFEFNYNVLDHLDLRTAYKLYDVETDYVDGAASRPLTPQHRVFANLSFETQKTSAITGEHLKPDWKFDVTYNWLSKQRYPSTEGVAAAFARPEFSPSIGTFNAQVTKVFSDAFEMYTGVENLTNQKQDMPIIDAENPFGSNFDTTFVYGPIFGRNIYAGLRLKLY